jgi:hypothetical protein
MGGGAPAAAVGHGTIIVKYISYPGLEDDE